MTRVVYFIALFVFVFLNFGYSQFTGGTNIYVSGTYTVPSGIKTISVQCYGAGGGGGGDNGGPRTGNGGGGGGYAASTFSVVGGAAYPVTVGIGGTGGNGSNGYNGQNGGDTSFDTFVIARGGVGGGVSGSGTIGNGGGLMPANTGIISWIGGYGGLGWDQGGGGASSGGGGGSSAGTASNGNNGSNTVNDGTITLGGIAPFGGAKGGNGDLDGQNGAIPGGGGGGGGAVGGGYFGGNGGDGLMIISYTQPTVTITANLGGAGISLTIVFSEAINSSTFTTNDILIGGTVGYESPSLSTSDNITWLYTAAVTSGGSVSASIADLAVESNSTGNGNVASNTVFFDACKNPSLSTSTAANTTCDPLLANGTASVVATTGIEPASGYSYQWFTGSGTTTPISGATNSTVSALAAGTYTIKVTNNDNTACFSTSTVIVSDNSILPTISVSSTADTYCVGGNGSATASPNQANYSYTWYDNSLAVLPLLTSANVTGLVDGNYYVSAKDNLTGCTSSPVSFSVADNSVTPLITIGTSDDSYCVGGNGTATAIASTTGGEPTGGYSYQWYTGTGTTNPISGANTSTINNLDAGDYTVKVTNNDTGCSAEETTTVDLFSAFIFGPTIGTITQPTCTTPTGTVELTGLGTSSYKITANPGGATINGSSEAILFSGLSANTTYTFQITYTASGCSSADSEPAVINSVPATPSITLGSSPSVIQGTTTAALPYTSTTGSPDQYKIDYDGTANAQTFGDLITTLPVSPISLAVPAAASVAIYNATISVINSVTGCEGSLVPFTVEVMAPVNATVAYLNTGLASSPLSAGATNQAIFGFSLTSTSTQSATAVNIALSSDPSGKFLSYSLVRSSDNSYATTGDNTVITGLTFTPSASQLSITGLSESLTTSAKNYFLIATVNSAVSTSTPAIQPSLNSSNITVTTGTVSSSATGTTYSFTASSASDIVLSTFTFPSNIAYQNYQEADLTAISLEVARFNLRDGGGASDLDALQTTLTSLSLSISNFGNLRKIALYDGATEVAEQSILSGTITFSGLNVAAPDNSSKTLSIRASFNAVVTDNQQFGFSITSATAASTGSSFAAANAGGASTPVSGDNNRIEVLASALKFLQQPTNTSIGVAMSPAVTIEAVDVLNNRDLDFNSIIGLLSSGTLSAVQQATAISGMATFSNIIHTLAGTGLVLTTTNSISITNVISNAFNVSGNVEPTIQTSNLTTTAITQNSVDFSVTPGNGTFQMIVLKEEGAIDSYPVDGIGYTGTYVYGTGSEIGLGNFVTGIGPANWSWSVGNLKPGTSYSIQSFALNDSDAVEGNNATTSSANYLTTSATGNPITIVTIPSTPTAISATAIFATSFTANWSTTNGSATGYLLDVSTDSFTSFVSGYNNLSVGNVTSYTVDTNLSAGTTYYYRIRADNSSGISTSSNIVSVVTLSATSAFSDIINSGSFSTPSNIAYQNYQETNLTSASLEVARFDLRDGGGTADADANSTTVNSITFSISNFSNIRQIALYDGANELAEQSVSSGTITFSGLNIVAPDNGSKSFSIRASFNAVVTDNQQFAFGVNAATAAATGSTFSAANAGGASSPVSGDNNRIEVTATKLQFVQQPSNTLAGVAMSPAVTIEAVDVLNNRDLDYIATVSLTSTGTLTGSPVSQAFVAGLGTYATLTHTLAGTGLTLATSNLSSITNATSNTFNITNSAPVITSVTSNANTAGTLKIGDQIIFTVDIQTPETGLSIAPTTYNGGTLTWSTANGGDTYTATYTVASGQTDRTTAWQLTGVTATNGSGVSAAVSGSDVVKLIDANAPAFSNTAPASGATVNNTQVSYALSENLSSGSITWTRTGGTADANSPHTKSLTGTELTAGTKTGITLTNNPTLVSGSIYSIAFAGTDAAGNTANVITNTNVTYSTDTTPPTVTISSTAPEPTNVSPIPVTITFSEVVTGFVVGDITVTNGTAGSFAGSGTTYTVNITPINAGAVTVSVAAGVAADAATNLNPVSNTLTRTFTTDTTPPSVTITSTATEPTNVSPIPITITFSESVTGFVVGDITVTNGTAGSFSGSGTTYTASITPTNAATVTVSIAAGVATDAASNANTASNMLSRTYTTDTTPPSVTITSTATDPTNVSPIPVTITFNESVTSFVVGDITVTNGTAGSFAGSGTTYTASITPTNAGTVTVSVVAGVANDAASNGNTASNTLTRTYTTDITAPTVTITSTSSDPTNVSPIPVTITFSESVTGFVVGDITVTNGTAGSFVAVNGTTYTANIAPINAGAVTVSVAAGVASDAATNLNTVSNTLTRTYTTDTTAPTVNITSTSTEPTNVSPIPVTITFSESVTGFVLSDITVTNGTAGSFAGSGTTYTASIMPINAGAVTVSVAAGVANDESGNANVVSNTLTKTYDNSAPTIVSISYQTPATSPTNANTLTFRVVFSEAVLNVDASDFTKIVAGVTAGAVSVAPLNSTTFDITVASVTGNGTIRLDVLSSASITDATGNAFVSGFTTGQVYTIDTIAPIFSATGPASGSKITNTTVSYTLSEELAAGTITWTRTAGVADAGSPHVQSLTGSELSVGGHPDITLINNPKLVQGAVYSIAFAGTDLAGNTSTPVSETNITFTPSADNLSDVAASSSFNYPQNINYATFQESADIQNSSTSISAAKFDVRDGGAAGQDIDPLPTVLTGITLDLGSNFSVIRRIALYDESGNSELANTDQPVSNQKIAFSGLSITAPDDGINSFTVRVSFKDKVTDNVQFSFTITAATTQAENSGLASSDGGGAESSSSGNNNRIEVISSTFKFIQEPSNTFINEVMTPSVSLEAIDANGNRDLDFSNSVNLSSQGTLTSSVTVAFSAGSGTSSNIIHATAGNGFTLTTSNSLGLTEATSSAFDIFDDAEDITLTIHSFITPNTADDENNVLYIENIDFFPQNTVKLIDRWGVPIKTWTNFTNYNDPNPEQGDFDFTSLSVGNYICIVEYTSDGNGNKKSQTQMITVLK